MDSSGDVRLVQWIFWEWDHEWVVVDFTCGTSFEQLEQRKGNYRLVFRNQRKCRYEVVASHYKETWTRIDPEIENRKRVRTSARRRLK